MPGNIKSRMIRSYGSVRASSRAAIPSATSIGTVFSSFKWSATSSRMLVSSSTTRIRGGSSGAVAMSVVSTSVSPEEVGSIHIRFQRGTVIRA